MSPNPAASPGAAVSQAPGREPDDAADGELRRPPRLFGGYALDLDGTVYLGEALLPGAAEAVAGIRGAGAGVVFLTNNPLRSPASYARKLSDLGIAAAEAEVVTPLAVLTGYLARQHAGAVVLTVAEPLVDEALTEAGFAVTTDPALADVVVVSFDRTFSYDKLQRAYRAVRLHGAALVATNPDPFCPTPDGGLPDCAAMLAAVEACTGARAEAVLGKPGEHMAAELLRRLELPPAEVAVVGDRIMTDITLGQSLGMASVLVLSGATAAADVAGSPVRPDYVIEGIGQLLPAGTGGPTDGSTW